MANAANDTIIDVGASELIANGDIKLKTGQTERITETGAVLADGTEMPADLIVLASCIGRDITRATCRCNRRRA